MLYTFEIYKQDKRKKEGVRLVDKYDRECTSSVAAERHAQEITDGDPKLEVEVYETMVERVNSRTREVYTERYDTPRCCSPASDLYWTM